jgi:hypothetical protein
MKHLILHVLFWTLASTSIQAKWATFEEAPIKVSYRNEITVDKDGKTKGTVELQFEILKEPGRDIAAGYNLKYNGDSTKIKILEAKTIYKGKEYNLDKNLIQDKPLASSPGGFDQKRQILLAFPKAEIGAKVFLKYDIITTEVPLPDFYANIFYFGSNEFVYQAHIKLHSQLPLHILVNDPKKVLKITKDADDNFHKMDITLTKPLYQSVINESSSSIINHKHLTWASVSSLNKWKGLSEKWGQQYAKVYEQTLPKEFTQIADIAAQKKDEIEQINTVTSLLNDKIQYMGDWRTVKGKFIPRNLDKIIKTQLGDCKDFSAATTAILNKIGYKAQIVFVSRGVGNFYPESLPGFNFNHAMVKAISKQGKVYWIDPTNFQSMADGIFPDIADKMALIADEEQPGYEKIPNVDYKHAQTISNRQIQITKNEKVIESGHLTIKNEEAAPLTGAALKISENSIKDILFNALSHSRLPEKNKKKLQLPNLKSRIVKDISFSYIFEQDNKILKTNLGQALKLTYNRLGTLFDTSQDYVTDILIDNSPHTVIKRTTIKNINAKNIESLNKEIKTPWLYIARKCQMNGNDLQINDFIIFYKNIIINEELKSPEFVKLKDELEKNFKDVAVVFNIRN